MTELIDNQIIFAETISFIILNIMYLFHLKNKYFKMICKNATWRLVMLFYKFSFYYILRYKSVLCFSKYLHQTTSIKNYFNGRRALMDYQMTKCTLWLEAKLSVSTTTRKTVSTWAMSVVYVVRKIKYILFDTHTLYTI